MMANQGVGNSGPVSSSHDEEIGVEELRLATVMTGGVSLAVWMGGLTAEIAAVLNNSQRYAGLLQLLRTRCTLDVVSGTSAGGINGALLAFGQARAADISVLRDIWFREAALTDLMRSPREKDPRSLLKGDEHFLPALQGALRRVAETGQPGVLDDEWAKSARERLTLLVTATLLQGESRSVVDDLGTVVQDADHRTLFRFSAKDLRDPDKIEHLALACRTTASFPGAFEASFLPIGESLNDGIDLEGMIDATISRYAVDGGVLVNKPLRPAIDAMFAAPARERVRRVLAYVVPDPGASTYGLPDRSDKPPRLQEVLLRSLLEIPQGQSVGTDLDAITEHNRQVDAQRRMRTHVLRMAGVELAGAIGVGVVFDDYRRLCAESAADVLLDEVTRQLNGLQARKQLPQDWEAALSFRSEAYHQRRVALVEAAEAALPHALPATLPDDPQRGDRLLASLRRSALDRATSVCLDLLRSAADAAAEPSDREVLLDEISSVYKARRPPGKRPTGERETLRRIIRDKTRPLRDQPKTPQGPLITWVTGIMNDWHSSDFEKDEAWESWQILGKALANHAPLLRQLAAHPGDEYRALVAYLLPQAVQVSVDQVIIRLLWLEAYEVVMAVRAPVPEQRVELAQFSADTRCLLDMSRRQASEKLTGLQLRHFGAFYKRSWRANDWMWGRLDGVGWLVHLLLAPSRLLALRDRAGRPHEEWCQSFLKDLEELVASIHPAAGEVMNQLWNEANEDAPDLTRREAALAELRKLGQPAAKRPTSMPATSMLVAAALQLPVLIEELPAIREQMDLDRDLGASSRLSGEFRHEFDRCIRDKGSLQPRDAMNLLKRCTVSSEKLGDEVGSDLFTYTAVTAAATGMTGAKGILDRAPAVLRPVIGTLHMAVLGVYGLARVALQRSRTAFATLCLLVTGGVVVLAATDNAAWRNAAWIAVVVAALYVVLRLSRDAWDAIGTLVIVLVLLAGFVLVFYPGEFPAAALHDWYQHLLKWLAGNDAWPIRAIGGVVVLLLAWALFRLLPGPVSTRRGGLRRRVDSIAYSSARVARNLAAVIGRRLVEWGSPTWPTTAAGAVAPGQIKRRRGLSRVKAAETKSSSPTTNAGAAASRDGDH